MKAIVQHRYGSPADVLKLEDIDKPVVGDNEVLVRVHAASVHPDIWHAVRGRPYILRVMGSGLLKPNNKVPGLDMAGTGYGRDWIWPGLDMAGGIWPSART